MTTPDALLREIAQLPSPWKWRTSAEFPDGERVSNWGCDWCGVQAKNTATHPATDCLWMRAQAALTRATEAAAQEN